MSIPWVLYICFSDGQQTILPVALGLNGSNVHTHTTIYYRRRSSWSAESALEEKFGPWPIIDVSDIESFSTNLVKVNTSDWDPRRYRTTILYGRKLTQSSRSLRSTTRISGNLDNVNY